MTWQCAAIDHGVTVFPDGRIGPCCQIGPEYLKPIELIRDPNRFQDLKTDTAPSACRICVNNERSGIDSYRQGFNNNKTARPGIQFLDIRNTNLCNLRCRYCGPHFSNQWATELNIDDALKKTDIDAWLDDLLTDSLQWIYFTGGEPMISADHWKVLDRLVDLGLSKNISLNYNSNLTTIRYKDLDIQKLWDRFRQVDLKISIDAVGEPLEYIRSGSDWNRIEQNISQVMHYKNVQVTLSPVISIMNVWFLPELYKYARDHDIPMEPIILHGPDYLALDVIPDANKTQALAIIDEIQSIFPRDEQKYQRMRHLINNNTNHCLFQHTLNHILLLDHRRGERLFDLMPFGLVAQQIVLENHEYQ